MAKREATPKRERPVRSKEEQLRKVLEPFAEWAWGPENGPRVIDKYFKQRPITDQG